MNSEKIRNNDISDCFFNSNYNKNNDDQIINANSDLKIYLSDNINCDPNETPNFNKLKRIILSNLKHNK